MKKRVGFGLSILILSLSCGVESKKEQSKESTVKETKVTIPASERVILDNKGIGPIKLVELLDIDEALLTEGKKLFDAKCTICHKVEAKFIGPSPSGVMKRRSPEWIMNMMLNPDEMLKKDPLAIALLNEFNGAPMLNQNLTEEEARAILEYFRTLD